MKLLGLSIPFFGALSEAVGTVLEKNILRKKGLEPRQYNLFSFLAISLLLLPIIVILFFISPENFPLSVNIQAFTTLNIFILFGVIIFSVLANLFTFYALKWEKITELEPFRLLQPLFAILLAFFIFTSERQIRTSIIISALIASSALIFSHIKKHHLSFNKFAIAAILGSLFFALEMIISNYILEYYPPLIFYFARCLGILIISVILYKPKPQEIDKKTWKFIFLASLIWIVYRLFIYKSYLSKGPIITTLLFMLTPIFIYALSYFYLKEKLTWRNILASLIILACVGYAMFVTNY